MRRPVFLLSAALVLATAIVVLYRILWLGYPVLPIAAGQTWQLFIDAYITPIQEDHLLALALPPEYAGKMIVEEQVQSRGYDFYTIKEGPNRVGVWSGSSRNGIEEFTYRAMIHSQPRRTVAVQSPLLSPYPSDLSKEERELVEELARDWLNLTLSRRFRNAVSTLKGEGNHLPPNADLLNRWQTMRQKHKRMDVALALFRASDLPARSVEGLRLTAGVQSAPLRWLEAWDGRRWNNLDPETVEAYPAEALLPLATGGVPAVAISGAEVSDIRWNISRQVISQWKLLYERIMRSASFLDRWSLLQLPPEFQGTFRILLLVPIGALIISALRNVVGLPTFGIFMPLLIALAFRNTGTLYGVTIFSGVLLVGFAVRSLLDKLHLLLIPRLSIILTLVITCFTLIALLGNKLGLREFMAVGLIPFVILTMTIERFFIIIEESGAREALVTAAGSAAVSVVTYGIISWEPLQLTFFVYPELILTVAALQILLGRYTGYRLSELIRFRTLGGPS